MQNFSEVRQSAAELLRLNLFKLTAVRHFVFSKKSEFGLLRTLRTLAIDTRTKFGDDNSGFELMLLIFFAFTSTVSDRCSFSRKAGSNCVQHEHVASMGVSLAAIQ